jgi:hypothetical protein
MAQAGNLTSEIEESTNGLTDSVILVEFHLGGKNQQNAQVIPRMFITLSISTCFNQLGFVREQASNNTV